MQRGIFGLLFMLFSISTTAQFYTNPEVVDGFFPTREALLENRPIQPNLIVTQLSVDSPEFFNSLLDEEFLYFQHEESLDSVRTDTLFAAGIAGVPYIQVQGEFYRTIVFGQLCYFATIQPLSGRSVATGASMGMDPWGNIIPVYSQNNMANEEFVFDLTTGEVRVLDFRTLEYFIEKDEDLYHEYRQLRKKEKRAQKYLFVRRFNENHPLPAYQ